MPINWIEASQRVAREDLVMFINACLTCTGQKEFYDDGYGQRISISFLHHYILANYRLLYARTLAAGINHFNQSLIILNLLASGRYTPPEHKEEEGALIAEALRRLPPQRAWDLLQQLRRRGINNRRARAIAGEYLRGVKDIHFHAVKYRSKVRSVAAHHHLALAGELGDFLFGAWKKRAYKTELFEHFRQAHYSADSVFKLPFTVAEGLARKHQISPEQFYERIQERMTLAEKLRFQGAAKRAEVGIDLNMGRLPLTKLALYILSLPPQSRQEHIEAFHQSLGKSAKRTLNVSPLALNKVAAVLDCSYSSYGGSEKRRRPLGVALGCHFLLQQAAKEYRAFWTSPVDDPLLVTARGQTNLAGPLLDALEWQPDHIVIVSDGWENDPPEGASEVLRVFRSKLDPQRQVSIVHCNPVFNSVDFSLKPLSPLIPTVGLRDAEDLPTMLGFADFAHGHASLAKLESYLKQRAQQLLGAPDTRSDDLESGEVTYE